MIADSDTLLLSGLHYFAVFGDGMMYEDNPCVPWAGAPPSVSEAQSLFQERCRSAGDWPTFNLGKMAIWEILK